MIEKEKGTGIRLVSSIQSPQTNGHSNLDPFENWLEPFITGEGLGPCDSFRPLGMLSRVDGTWLEHFLWKKVETGSGKEKSCYYAPQSCQANATTVFTHDPRWIGVCAFDEFTQEIRAMRAPPWHTMELDGYKLGPWTEEDTTRASIWFHRAYGIKLGTEGLYQALAVAAQGIRVHPIRDWLHTLEWDQIPRLETWLIHHFGAEDTPYTRAVSKCFLISLVARAMRPGCKVDTMIVLEGEQARFKSTALRTLVGDQWFVELSGAIDPKDTPQLLRGKWLGEFSELSAFKRTRDVELIKGFLSRPFDTYRAPYGRRSQDYPRQAVFAGSTNESRYLKDPTGARRFWPIKVTRLVNLRGLEVEREQLFAEALLAFNAGDPWWLTDIEIVSAAKLEQGNRYDDDVWTETVEEWLSNPVRRASGITIPEILEDCLEIEISKFGQTEAARVGAILRRLDWEPRGRGRPRKYHPPTPLPT